jgi:peptidoglycan/LPS O-acetylase OafA/YrhL
MAPAMASAAPPRFYAGLESLRGICALSVVLIHVPWAFHFRQSFYVQNAWLFVDFFFVLSGFVIATTHGRSARDRGAFLGFMIKRLFRLYPLHLATMAAFAVLIAARVLLIGAGNFVPPDWKLQTVAQLFLLHSWGVSGDVFLNPPSWSISTEFGAYLVFGFVCLAFSSPRNRTVAMAAIGLVSLLPLILFQEASLWGDARLSLFRCLYSFGLGVAVWFVVDRVPETVGRWLQWPAVAASLVVLAVSQKGSLTLLAPPCFALCVLALAAGHSSSMNRTLCRPVFLWLGRLSYSIYMVHSLILASMGTAVNRLPMAQNVWAGDVLILAGIGLVLAASAVTERYIERPWRMRGKVMATKIVGKRREEVPEPHPNSGAAVTLNAQ